MADNLGLDVDEVVILKETDVAHGGSMASYSDELVLTNKKIICISKGVFGGTKRIYHYPLDQIKIYNGIPQVKQGEMSDGDLSLDVYLLNGEEHFRFDDDKVINKWVSEVYKLFGVSQTIDTQNQTRSSRDNNSVRSAFREVGEDFKGIGRDFAKSLGFRTKEKTPKASKNGVPNQGQNNLYNKTKAEHRCPSCGKEIDTEAKFCASCGKRIDSLIVHEDAPKEVICPSCGTKLKPELRFCTECGTRITTPNPVDSEVREESIASKSKKKDLTIDQQIELLQKLKSLVDAGIISPEEFEQKKREIL